MKEENELHQLWDKLFKVIGDKFPEDILRFVCPDKKLKYKGKYEQERVVIEYQTADLNFWIMDGKVRKLLNIEPYSNWKKEIPELVFTRNGIITKSLDYKYEVISIVVLLEKKHREGLYSVSLGKEMINKYHFPVIDFQDVEKIFKEFSPLAPLILKVDRSYESKVIGLVKADKLLGAMTVLVLNRLGLSQEEALKMIGTELEEFREILLEVPIMKDVFEEWKLEDLRRRILQIIDLRFKKPKKVQQEIEKQIKLIKEEELNLLFNKAVVAEKFDEFKKELDKLVKKATKTKK